MKSEYFSFEERLAIIDMQERGLKKDEAIKAVLNTQAAFLNARDKGDSAICKLHGQRIKQMLNGIPYEKRALE